MNLPPPDPFWAKLWRRIVREQGLIAFVILAIGVALALLTVRENYRDLCRYQETTRQARIEIAGSQAKALVLTIVGQQIIEEGVSLPVVSRRVDVLRDFLSRPDDDPPTFLSQQSRRTALLGRNYVRSAEREVDRVLPPVAC